MMECCWLNVPAGQASYANLRGDVGSPWPCLALPDVAAIVLMVYSG